MQTEQLDSIIETSQTTNNATKRAEGWGDKKKVYFHSKLQTTWIKELSQKSSAANSWVYCLQSYYNLYRPFSNLESNNVL